MTTKEAVEKITKCATGIGLNVRTTGDGWVNTIQFQHPEEKRAVSFAYDAEIGWAWFLTNLSCKLRDACKHNDMKNDTDSIALLHRVMRYVNFIGEDEI